MAKRLFDLLLAAIGLLLLLPLGLVLALLIRLDSPGPVFFRQERVGRFGRIFRIHKFRTMQVDAPNLGPAVTVGVDPRITRLGHHLRHSRIDELPQLIDVLLGHMSLVGPRPEVPRFVAHYPEPWRSQVLAVRPGITDPASLEHLDEAALLADAPDPEARYINEVLPHKLRVQAEYAQQSTLWTDIQVIGRTVGMLLSRRRG